MHTICVQVDAPFLEHSRTAGNDLSTPNEAYHFPGLQPGDFWCLCLPRWVEAHEAGKAPKILLKATHASAIEFIDLDILKAYALDHVN